MREMGQTITLIMIEKKGIGMEEDIIKGNIDTGGKILLYDCVIGG